VLNNSKRVFLTPSCLKDEKTVDHILKILEGYKIPENRILKGVDMDILASGDLLVRCVDDEMRLFEINLTLPFGFTTKLIGNL
jgi:hypothetical protein